MLSQRNCNYGYASRLPATLTGTKNVRKREFPNRGKFTKKQGKSNHSSVDFNENFIDKHNRNDNYSINK